MTVALDIKTDDETSTPDISEASVEFVPLDSGRTAVFWMDTSSVVWGAVCTHPSEGGGAWGTTVALTSPGAQLLRAARIDANSVVVLTRLASDLLATVVDISGTSLSAGTSVTVPAAGVEVFYWLLQPWSASLAVAWCNDIAVLIDLAGSAWKLIDLTANASLLDADTATLEGGLGLWEVEIRVAVSRVTTPVFDGTYVLQINYTVGAGLDAYARTPIGTAGIPVTAGTEYLFKAVVKTIGIGFANLSIRWYDASGVVISTSSTALPGDNPTDWVIARARATAPAGAAFASLRIGGTGAINAKIWADSMSFHSTDGDSGTNHASIAVDGSRILYVAGRPSGTGVSAWIMTCDATTASLGSESVLSFTDTVLFPGQGRTRLNVFRMGELFLIPIAIDTGADYRFKIWLANALGTSIFVSLDAADQDARADGDYAIVLDGRYVLYYWAPTSGFGVNELYGLYGLDEVGFIDEIIIDEASSIGTGQNAYGGAWPSYPDQNRMVQVGVTSTEIQLIEYVIEDLDVPDTSTVLDGLQVARGWTVGSVAIASAGDSFRVSTSGTHAASPKDDGTVFAELGFTFTLDGIDFTHCWVNNNGNVTFDDASGGYDPGDGLASLGRVLAPFWGDVKAASNVRYGAAVVDGIEAFVASWIDVGYFDGHTDKLNTFQVVIYADGRVEYNYSVIQWDTGDGGNPARAGYYDGSVTYEVPDSGIADVLLDSNTVTGLVRTTNCGVPGRWLFTFPQ